LIRVRKEGEEAGRKIEAKRWAVREIGDRKATIGQERNERGRKKEGLGVRESANEKTKSCRVGKTEKDKRTEVGAERTRLSGDAVVT